MKPMLPPPGARRRWGLRRGAGWGAGRGPLVRPGALAAGRVLTHKGRRERAGAAAALADGLGPAGAAAAAAAAVGPACTQGGGGGGGSASVGGSSVHLGHDLGVVRVSVRVYV